MNEIEDNVIEFDDKLDLNIKINPDFYIHTALLNAQKTFLNPDIRAGFTQYRMFIEHIEGLCNAAGMLSDEYAKSIEEYKKTEEYIKEKEEYVKFAKLSNKKLNLLMSEVFKRKTLTMPLEASFKEKE